MPALTYHRYPEPGKFKTVPSKALDNREDLSLAYSPGVADVCHAIVADPRCVDEYTLRRNLVAVISNGTAVLGLGNIGPLAAKPVMEGKAVLFQKFAHLNAIDLEIQEEDPHRLVDIIASLAPSFGAINLEDIKAPECFYVEQELMRRLSIPVFHDDQHGTAITVAAALINALLLVEKSMHQIKCVTLGAGASALACLDLLVALGLPKENVFVCDSQGLIHTDRGALSPQKAAYAQKTTLRHLHEVMEGADVFLGLSRPGELSPDHVRRMDAQPIIFALSNPVPEIWPHEVAEACPDALFGTGRSDFPNQINNVLCFPFIFRGALDAGAPHINLAMKKACVHALVQLARQGFSDVMGAYEGRNQEFGREYFLPKVFDPRLLVELPLAVAQAAVDSGLASPLCLVHYRKKLIQKAYQDLPLFRAALLHPPSPLPVVYYEGLSPEILSAAQAMVRYGLARPGFVGDPVFLSPLIEEIPMLRSSPMLEAHQVSFQHRCLWRTSRGNESQWEGHRHHESVVFFMDHEPEQGLIRILQKLGWDSSQTVLRVGERYHGMEAATIGPFSAEKPPRWQILSPHASLREVIEKSALTVLMEDD